MAKKTSDNQSYSEKVLEINQKIDAAQDFNSALKIAAEEISKALVTDTLQIILHRPEQDS